MSDRQGHLRLADWLRGLNPELHDDDSEHFSSSLKTLPGNLLTLIHLARCPLETPMFLRSVGLDEIWSEVIAAEIESELEVCKCNFLMNASSHMSQIIRNESIVVAEKPMSGSLRLRDWMIDAYKLDEKDPQFPQSLNSKPGKTMRMRDVLPRKDIPFYLKTRAAGSRQNTSSKLTSLNGMALHTFEYA